MKNQDKASANYAKQFTKRKGKASVTWAEDFKDPAPSLPSKCKFCEKEHGPNECWQLQAECHYCYDVGHITKFCKKKTSSQTSPKEVVTCTQNIPFVNQSSHAPSRSCTVISKHYESSVEKVIIDSGARNHFFANCAYFFTYKEYHHEFQTDSREILTAYRYGNVILRLAHPDGSEITWIVKKVSWAPSLRQNLLSTISLARKRVEVLLR